MAADEMPGKRIGVIVPGFSADQEDWCIPALRNLVRELARSQDVQVFALRYPPHSASYPIDGTVVHALGGGLARGTARIGLFARARARIAAAHRERPLDVLHAFWADEPGVLAVTSAARFGIPAIVSLMGGELARLPDIGYGGQLGRANRLLTRHALRRAALVTVGSEYLRRMYELRQGDGIPLRVPLGVDTTLFSPRPAGESSLLDGGEVKLLTVASLIPVKDHAMLFRALAIATGRATTPELHLHVVGEGPLRGRLEALAGSLGIASRVTFHGAIRHENLPAYYRAADLCVQSSLHESQSLVVLEAAACGKATIGTAVGILPELGAAARVVAVGDSGGLAEVILAVLLEPGRAAAMGRLANQAVVEGYTIQRTAGQLVTLYANAVGESPAL